MKRRQFIKLFGGVAASWPLVAQAQQQSMPVIGYASGSVKLSEWLLAGVREGLADFGYFEGKNFRFEFRETNLQPATPILFQELLDQKVALLLIANTSFLSGAKAATQSTPIVFFLGQTQSKMASSPA